MTELTLEVLLQSQHNIEYFVLEQLISKRQRGRKDLDPLIDMVTLKTRAIEQQLRDIKKG